MFQIMLDHLRTKFKSSLSPEDLPGKPVMVKKETVLYRGKVLKIDTVHSKGAQVFATCRLVDFGTVHHMSITNLELRMGTLKSVCSSWFALMSRDKYEHTHLRVPIHEFFSQILFVCFSTR